MWTVGMWLVATGASRLPSFLACRTGSSCVDHSIKDTREFHAILGGNVDRFWSRRDCRDDSVRTFHLVAISNRASAAISLAKARLFHRHSNRSSHDRINHHRMSDLCSNRQSSDSITGLFSGRLEIGRLRCRFGFSSAVMITGIILVHEN